MRNGVTSAPRWPRQLVLGLTLQLLRSVSLRLQRLSRSAGDQEAERRGFVLHRGHHLPPRSLRGRMCGDAFRTESFYFLSAVHEAMKFTARLREVKDARVVDIGSGLGRLATGLLAEQADVRYLGIDANRSFVQWCKDHIERRHPAFQFVHLDMANALYNPGGAIGATDLRLPVDDASADVVNLWGVFTNMVPEHVEAYLAEIARILRPGGQCFLTAFVEDGVPAVAFNPPAYVPYACDEALTVVRYSRQWLFSTFERHGLQVEDFRYHGSIFPNQSELYLSRAELPVRTPAG
jgi:SAM-dependent methyltransferase